MEIVKSPISIDARQHEPDRLYSDTGDLSGRSTGAGSQFNPCPLEPTCTTDLLGSKMSARRHIIRQCQLTDGSIMICMLLQILNQLLPLFLRELNPGDLLCTCNHLYRDQPPCRAGISANTPPITPIEV